MPSPFTIGLSLFTLLAPLAVKAADGQGKVVYEAQCAPCHGMAGEGGYGARLAVPHLAHARTKADIIKIVQRGLPGTNMPSFGLLPDIEIAEAASYVQTLGQVPEIAPLGDAAKGRVIYQANGCPACHIMRGEGSGFGPELTEVGIRRNFAYLRKKIADPNAQITEGFSSVKAVKADGTTIEGIRVNEDTFSVLIRDRARHVYSLRKADLKSYDRLENVSMMPPYGGKLSEAQINDLVSFLAQRGER
jgi:putative heme-binding domain-containing protein